MGFGSTTLALAKCIILMHFPANFRNTKGIRGRARRGEAGGLSGTETRGSQGVLGEVSVLRHDIWMDRKNGSDVEQNTFLSN